jgi:hypothetical protein
LAGVLTKAGFGRSSPNAENGFIGAEFCFVAQSGTKQSRLSSKRRAARGFGSKAGRK